MKKIFLLSFILCASVAGGATILQDGGRADVYYRDGARFALEGRLAEAAKAFEQAVALDPSNGNAFYSLGNVYSEQGRWADAVNAYYKAVSLNKEDVEAYNALGVALSRRGQYTQAATAFERAIKIYPKWAEPHYNLSQVRRKLHDDAAAQAAYEQAIRLRPDYAANPPRTFMAERTNADAAPRSNILKAMNAVNLGGGLPENVNPTSGASAETRAPARVATKATGEAASSVARPDSTDAKAYPDSMDAKAFYDFGVKQARAGRYEEAVAALRQAVLLDRKNAAAYLALGDAYAAQGGWRDSVDAYEQAARLNPDDAETYRRLGRSYAKLRETTPAPKADDGTANAGAKAASPSSAAADDARPVGSSVSNTSVERAAGETRGVNVVSHSSASSHDGAASSHDGMASSRGGAASSKDGAAGSHEGAAGSRVAAPEADADPTAVYRVGPGDVLDIRVLDGRAHRTTSYEVTPTGLLAYPSLSEPLKVAGLTTEEVATRLGAGLRLRAGGADPEIAVGVREYASHAIIVSGMVKEAGTKILQREGVPLYVIIAYAQPLPGAAQAVVVARATGRTTTVDLSDARALKMLVRPGDVVTVRARPARAAGSAR
ncbi:MAG TPA: tetratricopeptide repeat protein [Pyrinomonadaceae bacterium]|jgi:tetratricopeptide (TPR) repeat protein/protein involved in polysaccharide export with SLBB domain|nr:tetratricopeptide repeat protein [Pyrinomonadaceae bacterium]